ncbi:NERD domain-containing protein [Bacillus sp. 1P06AnD]|uniref:NERD domain-containing protein n=1 Tax=Bacillus sp. 1P06AnD TaxID=3132208 RepID=UPI00399F87A5
MGQLIKVQDYVSRYEQDIFRYPTQFVRLKKQQWSHIHNAFEAGELNQGKYDDEENDWYGEQTNMLGKVKNIFKRNKGSNQAEQPAESNDAEKPPFQMNIPYVPDTIDELKISFLNQLFLFQMKWATSTIREKSYVDKSLYLDEKLKFLLMRFPDTFLVLYKPIFLLQKAPIETESIICTPTETWVVTFLEHEEQAVYIGSREKFWLRKHHARPDKKVLNPTIGLQRTEAIVKKLYSLYDVDLPIKKAIISREGFVDFPSVPYDVHILDKKGFPEWFESMRKMSAPLKHQQLKGGEALLDYSQTTSTMRMEWNEEIDHSMDREEEL